jgi:hypothetical protein
MYYFYSSLFTNKVIGSSILCADIASDFPLTLFSVRMYVRTNIKTLLPVELDIVPRQTKKQHGKLTYPRQSLANNFRLGDKLPDNNNRNFVTPYSELAGRTRPWVRQNNDQGGNKNHAQEEPRKDSQYVMLGTRSPSLMADNRAMLTKLLLEKRKIGNQSNAKLTMDAVMGPTSITTRKEAIAAKPSMHVDIRQSTMQTIKRTSGNKSGEPGDRLSFSTKTTGTESYRHSMGKEIGGTDASAVTAISTLTSAISEKNQASYNENQFAQHYKKGNKPSLIIHIGPSKTATSTIQRESIDMGPLLAEDKYLYIGKFADSKWRRPSKAAALLSNDDCFQQAATALKLNRTRFFNETPCWMDRTSGIVKYYRANTSLVLSDEAYSYKGKYSGLNNITFYQLLRVAYQDWNVTVVPTYRRYFEWILSTTKEVNRRGCLDPMAKWLHEKGKPCRNLWKMIHRNQQSKHFGGSFYHNLDVSLPTWREAGFPVSLLNTHDQQHITCILYCDLIGDTPHTCQECRKRPTSRRNAQSSSYTGYNDIIFSAAAKGLLDNENMLNKSRYESTWDLTHFHTVQLGKRLNDLPLICPEAVELEKLLNKSLLFEERVFPEDHYHRREEHVTSFWQSANGKKDFCAVDTERLLEGKDTWQQVLDAMQSKQEWYIRYV